eukprot:3679387-Amphidinium_carterae.1
MNVPTFSHLRASWDLGTSPSASTGIFIFLSSVAWPCMMYHMDGTLLKAVRGFGTLPQGGGRY